MARKTTASRGRRARGDGPPKRECVQHCALANRHGWQRGLFLFCQRSSFPKTKYSAVAYRNIQPRYQGYFRYLQIDPRVYRTGRLAVAGNSKGLERLVLSQRSYYEQGSKIKLGGEALRS